MNLLKFRPLANEQDYERIKDIIETGKFWCSKLWNLNDPMEGIYNSQDFSSEIISQMSSEKNKYTICSFSESGALNNNLLWGYYANGLKGIAIEIEIDNSEIDKIQYSTEENIHQNLDDVRKIITRKLKMWEYEKEYRYLKKDSDEGYYKIGKITKVYFGNPYFNISNKQYIVDNSHTLRDYNLFKKKLKLLCEKKNIDLDDYNFKHKGDQNGKTKNENERFDSRKYNKINLFIP